MADDLGIVYILENAQEFWLELEDIIHVPSDSTLSVLDNALKRFITFCASYHEQYLQSPLQLEHAIDILLDSDLMSFHSERMCEILLDEGQTTTDPHRQFVLYNVLLMHGRRKSDFLRSHKKWQPIIPLLMDYVLVDLDPDIDDTYVGTTAGSSSGWAKGLVVPIEAKLRSLSVRLMYEVCRVQKMSLQELKIFDDGFLDRLFDLVEDTRTFQDDSLNFAVVKLIVALNEQFMVAVLPSSRKTPESKHVEEQGSQNRVLRVLMRRLNSSQTFGESMIFMLNRASDHSAEDRCMQLLVLKMLYLLFTTKGTSEFFYTNDLCVLVDVFLRELVDLDEESESLRHTFLRVLHPLLTKTQLRSMPYKRPQIVRALESLVEKPEIRDIDPTTKRLVERCLSGEWCVQEGLRKNSAPPPRQDTVSPLSADVSLSRDVNPAHHTRRPSTLGRQRSLKGSRSAENLNAKVKEASESSSREKPMPYRLEHLRRSSNTKNSSSSSLPIIAATASAHADPAFLAKRRERADSADILESNSTRSFALTVDGASTSITAVLTQAKAAGYDKGGPGLGKAVDGIITHSFSSPPAIEGGSFRTASASSTTTAPANKPVTPSNTFNASAAGKPKRRAAPPPPPVKPRRTAPAIPVGRTNGGATIEAIASSRSPLH